MTTRLELQRPPARFHSRRNTRPYLRGYTANPHTVWGDNFAVLAGGAPSAGATAGIPGAWTPAGSTPPVSPAALAAANPVAVTASPLTAWTSGQYVQTRTAGIPGRATWTGSAWVGGAAPLDEEDAPDDLPGHPETATIDVIKAFVAANPHLAADILDHEVARGDRARQTLVAWLEAFVDAHDNS